MNAPSPGPGWWLASDGRWYPPRQPGMWRVVGDRHSKIVWAVVLLGFFTVVFLGWGLYEVSSQHSGTAAVVTVQSCTIEGVKHYQDCTGTWRSPDGVQKTVTIDRDPSRYFQTGDSVDVHIHGDRAIVDSRTAEIAGIAIGCVSLLLLIVTVIAGRRRPNAWI